MDVLANLNEAQKEAACFTEGYLRIIAGAGSGKTKLLVSRYAYLVKNYGIDSANILCVTFTNKAAGEMRRRIRKLIGEEYDTSLICTYHGFCARVLRDDVEKIFYPKNFQIIDTHQQKAILEDIYQEFELKLDYASFEKILKEIAFVKANDIYVAKMCSVEKCQILEQIESTDDEIIEEYLQRQKQNYAMDFHDLINFTLYMFKRCPSVAEKWQERLNYIQVDEFQDSSKREMDLVDVLAAKHKNLMIVGDPDQNIYEWRGSDVKLLVDFDKEHENTNTVFLNRNYRSTPEILKCANTLIEKNEYRLKKDLYTEAGSGAEVVHIHAKNEYEEMDKIVEKINRLRKEKGYKYSDFAVLYRSGFLSRMVEKKFNENGVPYEIFGGVKFYLRMEIQDVLAYLRLVVFEDDFSLKRIINTPRRKFGRIKMQRLMSIRKEGDSLFKTLKENLDDPVLKNSSMKEFCAFIEECKSESRKISVSALVEKVCSLSGYEEYIKSLGDMERFDNLSEFKRISYEYERNLGESITAEEFLNQITLQTDKEGEEESETVKLMTIHSAKGLEFPVVFVTGFTEGIFPSSKTVEERKQLGLEEERRLCYVAITRAEERLFLTDSEGFSQNETNKLPSRFLSEIGEENYVREGKISRDLLESMQNREKRNNAESNASLNVGDVVEHAVFGLGRITEVNRDRGSYKIKFKKLASERNISTTYFKNREKPIPEKKDEGKYEEKERLVIPEKQTGGNGKGNDNEPYTGDNLWKRDDVPKTGKWCTGVTDLGAPLAVCEMCADHSIRYVHHMVHDNYRSLDVGCVCAGKMEGDIEGAKRRESEFKNKQSRKKTFLDSKWKRSKGGNDYKKVNDHVIVLFKNKDKGTWKYSIDSRFCKEAFKTREKAICAAFEELEMLTRR